ncbi:MAG: DUF4835 family protein [candidate division KSB1 bacterium]|nr:DUF4835 family protein [candidate division KSB1 bacterium]MDZ7304569.1 DUF4835 family protein [candidate division KSB1 bacterium]MDZ7313636.1 DUF4835 family protein [candidate division KSB1 bacterium]
MCRIEKARLVIFMLLLLGVCQLCALQSTSYAAADNKKLRAKVTVILDKLPVDKKKKMAKFQEKVSNYINGRVWIEEDYVNPIDVGVQIFLEDSPSTVEDRYRCSLLVSGPDIQYFDKRARFPFQENEELKASSEYIPALGPIDFYIYLVIANELDKYGPLEGTPYLEKARGVVQQGKFSRFFDGWDWREETLRAIFSDNYKKFRELKDYYFYGLSLTKDEITQKRDYVKQAIEKLEEVLKDNKDNLAAKQFIDAHYQEIIELFKDAGDDSVFQILLRIDPDRQDLYQEYVQ